MKRIMWLLLSLIIIPLVIIAGIFFFSIVAAIIVAIVGLVVLLSLLMYFNKKFKYIVSKIKYSVQNKEEAAEKQKKTKRNGREHEVVIEHVKEREKNDKI